MEKVDEYLRFLEEIRNTRIPTETSSCANFPSTRTGSGESLL